MLFFQTFCFTVSGQIFFFVVTVFKEIVYNFMPRYKYCKYSTFPLLLCKNCPQLQFWLVLYIIMYI